MKPFLLVVLGLVACTDSVAGPSWFRRDLTLCVADLSAGTLDCARYNCEVFGYPGGRFWEHRDCRRIDP
jgi:hypothetical protein